jgi:hypothetical protein
MLSVSIPVLDEFVGEEEEEDRKSDDDRCRTRVVVSATSLPI